MHEKTIIHLEDLDNNPRCPHGPSILFEDSVKGKKRKYWACSAYRDKKSCDFYVSKKQKITKGTRFKWEENEKMFLKNKDHTNRFARLSAFKESGAQRGKYCQSCEQIFCDNADLPGHLAEHKVAEFDANDLKTPSKLLEAKSANKKEAQYFFSKDTLAYLIDAIKSIGATHVLCIGTPTLFENLPKSMSKLLLDIDSRYLGLYSPREFVWCNMMNFHFFSPQTSLPTFREFIRSSNSNLAIVIDPPFGARPELLLNTLNAISRTITQLGLRLVHPKVLWVWPYFLERKLLEAVDSVPSSPKLKMSDYRVCYLNHKEYSGDTGGRKLGSPVRLFTNHPLSRLPVPRETGYKLCSSCNFFVAETNVHCAKCGVCSSKDGRPYVHCDDCSRCVKETYNHCQLCSRCHLPSFQCNKKEGAKENAAKDIIPLQTSPGGNTQQPSKRKHKNKFKKNGKKRRFY